MSMRPALLVLAGALALDVALGEPPNALHPVAWMGSVIGRASRLAPRDRPRRELAVGVLLALAIPSAFAAWVALALADARLRERPGLALVASALVLKTMFALRALVLAALRVRRALDRGAIDEARLGLRSLCSRDPSALEAPALIAATVESVAENASDSFVAPLFYFALFGLPGAVFYRAVNTLDAMIGYHGRYEWLGKASARLDDLLNLAPARVTAALVLLAGALSGHDARRGLAILLRDGGRTESPNAGRPMAAMAGLLGVSLEKRGHYRLGDDEAPLTRASIGAACRVVVIAAALWAALLAIALSFTALPLAEIGPR
jgi:adenosylcobinamide-phosphate synthase